MSFAGVWGGFLFWLALQLKAAFPAGKLANRVSPQDVNILFDLQMVGDFFY